MLAGCFGQMTASGCEKQPPDILGRQNLQKHQVTCIFACVPPAVAAQFKSLGLDYGDDSDEFIETSSVSWAVVAGVDCRCGYMLLALHSFMGEPTPRVLGHQLAPPPGGLRPTVSCQWSHPQESMSAKGAWCSMGTKGAQRKILGILHINLQPNLDPRGMPCTQCKLLYVGNYLNPSFDLFSLVGCSITESFTLLVQ